jgi:hypothetical protein
MNAIAEPAAPLVSRLNRDCYCVGADVDALRVWLQEDLGRRGLARPVIETHPHLFSALPVFVSREHVRSMQAVIGAVESVVALPAYQAAALAGAPEIARIVPGTRGVFFGYDFHIGDQGPRLIEINTNAGGALLNAELGRAQRACCDEVRGMVTGPVDPSLLEERLYAMFLEEWRLVRGDRPLQTIAIVDDAPEEQYLYPEFLLFQRLFEAQGVRGVIADPAQLDWRDGELSYGGERIDLVYNRLTDFYFQERRHAALRDAYRSRAAVITPHPRAHALFANKRNLALLTDPALLQSWGVPAQAIETLRAGIPVTRAVQPGDAQRWWAERRGWFFKPAAGFGSRGSYRGDKLTRKAFGEILEGDYVAQALVAPSERVAGSPDAPQALKLDLRNYVYDGEVQLIAARLYQGQTTNFRTPGGGFAPVFYPPESSGSG